MNPSARIRLLLFVLVAAAASAATTAPLSRVVTSDLAALPAYVPEQQVSGTIRIWGHGSLKHDFMGPIVRRWATRFARYQPGVRLVDQMYGTASAIGALYTGAGDIAILGEELDPAAARAFVACRPSEGRPPLRTWGQLGLTGAWQDRRIHVYTFDTTTGTGLFLQRVVMHDRRAWAWNHVQEFSGRADRRESARRLSQHIGAAVAGDRFGVGLATGAPAGPQVHAVALATDARGPFYEATTETLRGGKYPLMRFLPVYLNRAPGRPLPPVLREFLRYILSSRGQAALAAKDGFLPLPAPMVPREIAKLN